MGIFDSILQNEGKFYIIVQNDGIVDTTSQNKDTCYGIGQNESRFYIIGQINGLFDSIIRIMVYLIL